MLRVIDANINRVSEGLRVLEDIARFIIKNRKISKDLKNLRHYLRNIYSDRDNDLLQSRDSINDFGPDIEKNIIKSSRTNINKIIIANSKRVQEGLRTLEEITENNNFRDFRYKCYTIEKKLLMTKKIQLPNIYGITHSRESLNRNNIEIVKEMITAGIKLIQYREKDLSIKEMLEECIEIRKLTLEANVIFIVNDHIDIALITNADGVHIGQDDLPIKEVRKILGPDKIIGLSTHSPKQGKQAVKDGADYIGVGPIHATKTKDNVCEPVGYEYLEWVVNNLDIPFVTIGGIKEHNIHEVLNRGSKSVALVSEITSSENIKNKVNRLNKIIGDYNV